MRSPKRLKGGLAKPAARAGGGEQGWIWGVHACLAALANPRRDIRRIVATRNGGARLPASAAGVELLAPDAIDALLPPGAVHQGIAVRPGPLAPFTIEEACAPANGWPVIVLDQVTDPQNVGAIFRTAAAFGARAVIMQDRHSPALSGALAKAAAGAIEIVPHVSVVNIARALDELSGYGYLTIALEGEAQAELADVIGRDGAAAALVLGAEGRGLRELVSKSCAARARIAIAPETESLNVAAAAAVALYEATRRST